MPAFIVSTDLAAAAERVWQHAASPTGINRELSPLLRMTFPGHVDDVTRDWQPGKCLFRSWLLLFGLIPVEYDDLAFVEVDAGRRFLERSCMLTQRVWEHERTVEPLLGGCRVIDRIRFEPRIRWLGGFYRPVFLLVFRLRHRNLKRDFGALPVRT